MAHAVLTRLEGWEVRLDAVIEAARRQPYALGVHDCLRVACAAFHALTGVDHWPRWSGRYKKKSEALRLIRQMSHNLAAAVSSVIGIDPSPSALGRRGDLALYRDAAGEHLGVCVGDRVAVLGEQGLEFVPLLDPAVGPVWRVG